MEKKEISTEQPRKFALQHMLYLDGAACIYSACITLGRKGKRLFVLDVFRKRLDYPDLKRAVRELAMRFRPTNILIEDKASGTQLIQELVREGVYGVTR